MSPVEELLNDLRKALVARRDRLPPEDRAAYDASCLPGLVQWIESLRQSDRHFTACDVSEVQPALSSVGERAETAYQRAEREEREQRHKDLLCPPDERRFDGALRWAYARGSEETLAVLCRIRETPPYSCADALALLAEAEQRIRERLGLPLPEQRAPTAEQETSGRSVPFPVAQYQANRNRIPEEELHRYAGQWVAFSPDGASIVESGPDLAALDRRLTKAGKDLSDVVVGYIPDEDTLVGGAELL